MVVELSIECSKSHFYSVKVCSVGNFKVVGHLGGEVWWKEGHLDDVL